MKVAIAGGGIGGLVLALGLHELGLDITVYEAAPEVRPLGLREALESTGVLTAELAYYSRHGQRIWSEPRGLSAGYRWPQISIHRGELHMLLLAAVRERLGADRVRLGHALHTFVQDEHGVEVGLTTRASGGALEHARCDVLIGADGVHSRVRALLHEGDGAPRWNGTLLWRGVTQAAPFLTGRSMIMAGHADQKFVCYPIGREHEGKQLLNWIAELRLPERRTLAAEDWNAPGQLADFLPRFESFVFDWLDVPRLIRDAALVRVYPLIDRDPLPSWGRGRVTLLGDAAHPMYPVGSNGASQAILDARVLTGCLRDLSPDEALRRYEALRRPSTSALTLANRQQGPEECMTLVEARAPEGFAHIDQVISQSELAEISAKYKRLAGFTIDELNRRPTLLQQSYLHER